MARCLVGLIRLAVDKRDLHFLWPITKHYDHHLSAVLVTYRTWQPGLKRRWNGAENGCCALSPSPWTAIRAITAPASASSPST